MARNARDDIADGRTTLGIELGSTRIKAVLIGSDHAPIAVGAHDWENQFVDRVWTYSTRRGLGRASAVLCRSRCRRGAAVRRRADRGRCARRLGNDARLPGLRRRRRAADAVPDLAEHQHRRGRRKVEPALRAQHPPSVERRPSVPGDPERRRSSRSAPAPDDVGRLRARPTHRGAGARHRRRQWHVPDRHQLGKLRRAAAGPVRPTGRRGRREAVVGRAAAYHPPRRGTGRRTQRTGREADRPDRAPTAGRGDVPARGGRRDRHGRHQLRGSAHRQRQRRNEHLRDGRSRARARGRYTANSIWSRLRPATRWRWCTATTGPAN